MLTDLLFNGIILLLIVHYGRDSNCGIPIFKWTLIYFFILGVRSFANFLKIIILRHFAYFTNFYSLFSLVVVDGFFLGWLIYGNIIFYSGANNCKDIDNAKNLY